MAGLTSAGLTIKSVNEIVDEINAYIEANVDQNINTDADSLLGQVIQGFANQLGDVWESAQELYDAFNPAAAEGQALTDLSTITGTNRQAAQFSTAEVTFNGAVGTVIPSGFEVTNGDKIFATNVSVTLANATLNTGQLVFDASTKVISRATGSWLSDGIAVGSKLTFSDTASNNSTFTATSVEALNIIVFESVTTETAATPTTTTAKGSVEVTDTETGPTDVSAYAIDTLTSTRSGVYSVTNTEEGVSGSDEESDEDLRLRRKISFQLPGSGVDGALRAKILNLSGVEYCQVISNRTDTISGTQPAKSFECVVYPDGAQQTNIVKTIFNNQPAGMESFGTSSFQVTDTQGFVQEVSFSYAQDVDAYASVELTVTSAFPASGSDQIIEAIVDYIDGLTVGEDVLSWEGTAAVANLGLEGITNAVVSFGSSASPSGRTDLSINSRQKAVGLASRVAVTTS